MNISVAEISSIIRQQIADYDKKVDVQETGIVLTVGDGIARLHGLENAMAGELLEFPHDVMGMVLNLEEDNVGCALFGDANLIREGDTVSRTKRIVEVPVGEGLLGRVVDSMGVPIDGKGKQGKGKSGKAGDKGNNKGKKGNKGVKDGGKFRKGTAQPFQGYCSYCWEWGQGGGLQRKGLRGAGGHPGDCCSVRGFFGRELFAAAPHDGARGRQ